MFYYKNNKTGWFGSKLNEYESAMQTGDYGNSLFMDSDEVSHYAEEAVLWAVDTGLMQGYSNNKLLSKNSATRAEAATLLMRFMEGEF